MECCKASNLISLHTQMDNTNLHDIGITKEQDMTGGRAVLPNIVCDMTELPGNT